MPYRNVRELPPEIKKALPVGAQHIFMQVVNSTLEGGGDDASAFRKAWAAVGRAGYSKGSDGRWHKKELGQTAQKGAQSVTKPGQIANEFTGKEKSQDEPVDPRIFTMGGDPKQDKKQVVEVAASMRQPAYGNALSFAEYDDWDEARRELGKVDNQVWVFRSIIDNIFADEELSAPEKAAAIEKVAADLKGRVTNPPDIKADVRKTEGGIKFPAADYAYVPDTTSPSTWKLRLAESPGKFTVAQVARAITALQPGGFRGQRVKIPSADKSGVIRKISAAIGKISGADETQIDTLRERLTGVKEEKSFDVEEFWKVLDIEDEIDGLPELSDEEVTEDENELEEPAEEDEKAGKRVKKGFLSKLENLAKIVEDVLEWARYKDKDTITKRLTSGFKVYKGRDGKLRWIGTSANAFKDRHQEIFSTKALRNMVRRADKSGERGPLLLYHEPDAKIGTCDFQAMEGRFLVESGIFDGTKLGKKAAQYFSEHQDEEFGLSVGYEYKPEDREDKIYDWMEVLERSVTPANKQANIWCEFSTIATGGKQLDATKVAFLTDVFGEDTAKDIVEKAASRTKELEKTVDFKEETSKGKDTTEGEDEKAKDKTKAEESFGTLKMLIGKIGDADLKKQLKTALSGLSGSLSLGEGAKEEEDKDEEKDETKEPTETGDVEGREAVRHLVGLVTEVTKKVGELGEAFTAVQSDIKELQKSDDEKTADRISPRSKVDKKTAEGGKEEGKEEDSEAVKAVKEGLDGGGEGHPAAGHLSDLLKLSQRARE